MYMTLKTKKLSYWNMYVIVFFSFFFYIIIDLVESYTIIYYLICDF